MPLLPITYFMALCFLALPCLHFEVQCCHYCLCKRTAPCQAVCSTDRVEWATQSVETKIGIYYKCSRNLEWWWHCQNVLNVICLTSWGHWHPCWACWHEPKDDWPCPAADCDLQLQGSVQPSGLSQWPWGGLEMEWEVSDFINSGKFLWCFLSALKFCYENKGREKWGRSDCCFQLLLEAKW